MTDVQGRCPACGWATLFLADGGHVTCSRLECPNPSAADELLHGEHVAAMTPLVCSDERHAAKVTDLERRIKEQADTLAALRAVARDYCPACGRGDAAPTTADWEQQKQRAEFYEGVATRMRDRAEVADVHAKRLEAALAEARRLHRETCPMARGELPAPAFTCSMCEALDGPAPANPPGSTREQLPDEVLAAIRPGPYLSTACHAAFLCETTEPTEALTGWPQRLHARCRTNNKFTGKTCICSCHTAPAPAATQATDGSCSAPAPETKPNTKEQ